MSLGRLNILKSNVVTLFPLSREAFSHRCSGAQKFAFGPKIWPTFILTACVDFLNGEMCMRIFNFASSSIWWNQQQLLPYVKLAARRREQVFRAHLCIAFVIYNRLIWGVDFNSCAKVYFKLVREEGSRSWALIKRQGEFFFKIFLWCSKPFSNVSVPNVFDPKRVNALYIWWLECLKSELKAFAIKAFLNIYYEPSRQQARKLSWIPFARTPGIIILIKCVNIYAWLDILELKTRYLC